MTMGTHTDAELVNTILDLATTTLRADEHPQVHSEFGQRKPLPLSWPAGITRMEKAGLSRSKKGPLWFLVIWAF